MPETLPVSRTRADMPPRIDDIVGPMAAEIARLAPGPLAELRRSKANSLGSPAFWRLVERHRLPDSYTWGWQAVATGMALMTARGRAENKKSAHAPDKPLGRVLASGEERSLLSDLRLARLLNSRGPARRALALRVCRLLGQRDLAVDWRQMARLILTPDDDETCRRIARAYYGARQRKEDTSPSPDEHSSASTI